MRKNSIGKLNSIQDIEMPKNISHTHYLKNWVKTINSKISPVSGH